MQTSVLAPSDHRIQLPDGRWLGYAEYGDPAGRPVMSFHGGLSCRLDARFASAVCDEMRIRLIAVDRPGTGLSDDYPRRTLLDWPQDVAFLARSLGIDRFAILGWSNGGPFALSCAYAIPDSLTHVATIGGMAPIDDRPGAIRELGLTLDRVLFRLVRRAPRAAALLLRATRRLPPRVIKWSLLRDVGPSADRAIVKAFAPANDFDFIYESLRPGPWGAVEEYLLLSRPWGFSLSKIEKAVDVWHGSEDRIVPVTCAHFLAERLPRGRLKVVPGQGHFLSRSCLREILSTLVD